MDKTLAGLLGAFGALVAAAPTEAALLQPATDTVLHASGYSELLRPVPNSLAILRAMDAATPDGRSPVVRVDDRDHHHHHRAARRPPPRRDHHHHNSDRLVFR